MSTMDEDVQLIEEIRVIELNMMEPKKYYPLTMCSSMCIRGVLYPFNLIKTRLQIQVGKDVYKGTFDALRNIPKNEGVAGLYRGFWFNSFQLIPSLFYITTYENVRNYMKTHTSWTDHWIRSFVAGGTASIVGQTLAVPIDIVTQHMMLLGQRRKKTHKNVKSIVASEKLRSLREIHIPDEMKHKRFGAVNAVILHVYKNYGMYGFYKGYFVSIAVFAPNSALWWLFYDKYSEMLTQMLPQWVPRLPLQCLSAPMAGISAAFITNPLDVIRARMQVRGTSFKETYMTLWAEEHYRFVLKGLSARLFQSSLYSFFIILGYETIKRMSLLDEYKDSVRW